MSLCTKHIGSPFLAREGSQRSRPSFVAHVPDPQRRSARSGSKSERESRQDEKWQNFNSSGPGNSESGGEGEEGEEGTGVRVKSPRNQLERKRVRWLRLHRTDLMLYTTVAFTQKHRFPPSWRKCVVRAFLGLLCMPTFASLALFPNPWNPLFSNVFKCWGGVGEQTQITDNRKPQMPQ